MQAPKGQSQHRLCASPVTKSTSFSLQREGLSLDVFAQEDTSPHPQALGPVSVMQPQSDTEMKEECCTATLVCRSPGFAGN